MPTLPQPPDRIAQPFELWVSLQVRQGKPRAQWAYAVPGVWRAAVRLGVAKEDDINDLRDLINEDVLRRLETLLPQAEAAGFPRATLRQHLTHARRFGLERSLIEPKPKDQWAKLAKIARAAAFPEHLVSALSFAKTAFPGEAPRALTRQRFLTAGAGNDRRLRAAARALDKLRDVPLVILDELLDPAPIGDLRSNKQPNTPRPWPKGLETSFRQWATDKSEASIRAMRWSLNGAVIRWNRLPETIGRTPSAGPRCALGGASTLLRRSCGVKGCPMCTSRRKSGRCAGTRPGAEVRREQGLRPRPQDGREVPQFLRPRGPSARNLCLAGQACRPPGAPCGRRPTR